MIQLNENKDVIYASFILCRNGLSAIGEPTFKQWEEVGEFIRKAEGAVHFWIGDWLNYGEKKYGEMYTQALDETKYKYQTLVNDVWVASKVEFSRRRENLSYKHHQEVASLEPDEQVKLLDIAEKNDIKSKEFRKVVRDFKSKIKPSSELPEGEFNVIYADPPWKYNDELIEGYGAAEHHYPAMEIEELCDLSIPSASNAVLFIWVTSPFLEEVFRVINAWGFEYKTSFVWDKVKHNYGHYNSVRHEFLLICTKGSFTPEGKTLFDSVVTEERSNVHSQKPDKFYEIIETLYPRGKYLELFNRRKREKWQGWGNEV